jgi:hypothetical protein
MKLEYLRAAETLVQADIGKFKYGLDLLRWLGGGT